MQIWKRFRIEGYERLILFGCRWFRVSINWVTGVRDSSRMHDHSRAMVGFVVDGSYTEVVGTPDGTS